MKFHLSLPHEVQDIRVARNNRARLDACPYGEQLSQDALTPVFLKRQLSRDFPNYHLQHLRMRFPASHFDTVLSNNAYWSFALLERDLKQPGAFLAYDSKYDPAYDPCRDCHRYDSESGSKRKCYTERTFLIGYNEPNKIFLLSAWELFSSLMSRSSELSKTKRIYDNLQYSRCPRFQCRNIDRKEYLIKRQLSRNFPYHHLQHLRRGRPAGHYRLLAYKSIDFVQLASLESYLKQPGVFVAYDSKYDPAFDPCRDCDNSKDGEYCGNSNQCYDERVYLIGQN